MGRYSNTKRGYRVVDGERIYFDSMSEANYYRFLVFLKKVGEIKDFIYHPPTFDFTPWVKHGTTRYEVDFLVFEKNGSSKYIEVKSTEDLSKMDQKSRTKIKRFKKYFPNLKIEVISTKRVRELNLMGLIPDWEGQV